MALFKDLGSAHTQSFPFGFSVTISLLTQLVGFWTSSIISKSTIRFNSFSNFDFKGRGVFLTGVRDCQQITSVTLNGFCPLSNLPPPLPVLKGEN